MNLDLIIFDCDGVLVDSEPIANRVMAEVLTELGVPTTYEDSVREYVGRTMPMCVEIIERKLGGAVPADFLERLQARTFAAFERELRPVEGVREALDLIDRPVCVASNGGPDKMRFTLGLTGLLPRFEGKLFSALEVERGKPHPDLFLFAAGRMKAEPGRCAVVEDGVFGVEAALAAGMAAFGYAPEGGERLEAAGARVFRDMRELPGLVVGSRK